jgi:hypothetical protein
MGLLEDFLSLDIVKEGEGVDQGGKWHDDDVYTHNCNVARLLLDFFMK